MSTFLARCKIISSRTILINPLGIPSLYDLHSTTSMTLIGKVGSLLVSTQVSKNDGIRSPLSLVREILVVIFVGQVWWGP